MLEKTLQYRLSMILILSLAVFLSGCETAYYGTMEKLGYHKRDLMVNRVESARDAQEDAKEEFESALEKFSSVLCAAPRERSPNGTCAGRIPCSSRFPDCGGCGRSPFCRVGRRTGPVLQRQFTPQQCAEAQSNKTAILPADQCHEAGREKNGSGPHRLS